ncbi:hypothetical protein [Pedococcus bigeumensis]|nr:hypothetical protein [Pedococcus bigeumensis]
MATRTNRLGTIMNTLNTTLVSAANTGGLQSWIKDNVIPLLLLLIAVMLFVLAQRGDNAKAMKVVAGVVVALAVLGIASSGQADNLGAWMAGLITG